MASTFQRPSRTAPAKPVAEHQHAHDDQQHRPELLDAPPGKPVEIVEQQEKANADDKHWANGPSLAELFQRILQRLAREPRLRSAICVDGHVDPQSGETDPERGVGAATERTVNANDEQEQKYRQMNYTFTILLVVKGTEAR